MIVAPEQKRFAASAKAAMHMKDLSIKTLAAELGVHPNSVGQAIKYGMNARVLALVCERLELSAPPMEASK